MQDRFKFRIFDKKEKVMHYIDFVVTATGYIGKIFNIFNGVCSFKQTDFELDKNCILMQCTGLKDKNRKLIYDGDIVKLTGDGVDNIHVVKFGDFAMYDFDFQEDYEKGSTAVYGWYLCKVTHEMIFCNTWFDYL